MMVRFSSNNNVKSYTLSSFSECMSVTFSLIFIVQITLCPFKFNGIRVRMSLITNRIKFQQWQFKAWLNKAEHSSSALFGQFTFSIQIPIQIQIQIQRKICYIWTIHLWRSLQIRIQMKVQWCPTVYSASKSDIHLARKVKLGDSSLEQKHCWTSTESESVSILQIKWNFASQLSNRTKGNTVRTNSQIRDTLHCQSLTKLKVVKWC